MQFPKITVVVNKIKKSILYPAVAVKSQRCDASVWPGGDILTFVSSLGNSNKEEHYSFLFLPLLHSWGGGKYIYQAAWMNTSWLQVSVSVTSPQRSEASCQTVPFPILLIPLPSFVLQGHWWSWSQPAVTMPATLTASSQCSCAHYRRWCGNTWAPSRLTQGWLKPAQVHKYSGKMWGSQWQM